MNARHLPALLLATLALGACRTSTPPATSTPAARDAAPAAAFRDPHSSARPDEVRTTHLALELDVDFAARRVRGTATWSLERRDPKAPLVLDVKALTISSVRAGGDVWRDVAARREKVSDLLGDALTVPLAPGDTRVEIVYETTDAGTGLLWLAPAQTAGKVHPYLFSQAQAIHARTFVPCQDTPAVRTTFDATLRVPAPLVALMGAEALPPVPDGASARRFGFRMRQPIPSYLIAFAVGDLAFRPLGKRTGVWSEPSVVDAAAREFADTERMVDEMEARFGPYRWDRYDILVMPPSFPAGGMENPRLTFVSPTLLAGDRSLVATISHELAHMWSGNLVTNATWSDLWLNEGFTSYLEQRVIETLYGRERHLMESMIEEKGLLEEMKGLAPADQRLAADFAGRDPEDVFTGVAYQKGALFLRRLERVFGRDAFDPFLRRWFDANAFRSRSTRDFTAFLKSDLFARFPEKANAVDLARWLDGPGLPDDAPIATSQAFARVDADVAAYRAGTQPLASIPTAAYTSHEWLRFVRALDGASLAQLHEVDARYGLTSTGNAEVASQWLALAARSGYRDADARIDRFLLEVGRPKLIKPIYAALAATPAGRARAEALLERARPGYHAQAVREIETVLKAAAGR